MSPDEELLKTHPYVVEVRAHTAEFWPSVVQHCWRDTIMEHYAQFEVFTWFDNCKDEWEWEVTEDEGNFLDFEWRKVFIRFYFKDSDDATLFKLTWV